MVGVARRCRAWLVEGKRIEVERAPTWFGPVNLRLESAVAAGRLSAQIEFLGARRPRTLLVRLRHPEQKPLRAVTVNGTEWKDFDPAREWVRLPNPAVARHTILARY